MSVKKQAAFVCDITGEASMDETSFWALKLTDERKPRHVHKDAIADQTFEDVMTALYKLHDEKVAADAAKANGKAKETAKS